MDITSIEIVKEEMKRLEIAIDLMELKCNSEQIEMGYNKHTAAVRRASMDLTRALSIMRRAE